MVFWMGHPGAHLGLFLIRVTVQIAHKLHYRKSRVNPHGHSNCITISWAFGEEAKCLLSTVHSMVHICRAYTPVATHNDLCPKQGTPGGVISDSLL